MLHPPVDPHLALHAPPALLHARPLLLDALEDHLLPLHRELGQLADRLAPLEPLVPLGVWRVAPVHREDNLSKGALPELLQNPHPTLPRQDGLQPAELRGVGEVPRPLCHDFALLPVPVLAGGLHVLQGGRRGALGDEVLEVGVAEGPLQAGAPQLEGRLFGPLPEGPRSAEARKVPEPPRLPALGVARGEGVVGHGALGRQPERRRGGLDAVLVGGGQPDALGGPRWPELWRSGGALEAPCLDRRAEMLSAVRLCGRAP
mmetsp:Transcript_17863/g.45084  ORF Transcript_17863/g.45084 Transcript_17863/m.45084 type:complete len:260 (-) Transcript_17863:49-828(-)